MSVAAKAEPKLTDAEIVAAYLTASMIPDPDAAAAYMKPGTIITFTGGREFDHPRGPTGFNAARYRWVKKKMDRFDVCPGKDETVVYSIGTLYGEWIDGTPFEGNRYVDRFRGAGGVHRQDGCLERQRRADSGERGSWRSQPGLHPSRRPPALASPGSRMRSEGEYGVRASVGARLLARVSTMKAREPHHAPVAFGSFTTRSPPSSSA